jgi:hypothetical protein
VGQGVKEVSGVEGNPVRSDAVEAEVLAGVRLGRRWRKGVDWSGEVAGVCAVLGEVLVGPGDGRSDPSTWMASAAVGVNGGW